MKELNEKMISAAKSGDNQEVEAALEEGPEITSKNLIDDTVLHSVVLTAHFAHMGPGSQHQRVGAVDCSYVGST